MFVAQKIIQRGSYVRISRYFDSIESLIEEAYYTPQVRESGLKKFKKNFLKFFGFSRRSANVTKS